MGRHSVIGKPKELMAAGSALRPQRRGPWALPLLYPLTTPPTPIISALTILKFAD